MADSLGYIIVQAVEIEDIYDDGSFTHSGEQTITLLLTSISYFFTPSFSPERDIPFSAGMRTVVQLVGGETLLINTTETVLRAYLNGTAARCVTA